MAGLAYLRARWPFPTLEENVERALGQQVLAAERAYRIHRYVPIALGYVLALLIGALFELGAALEAGLVLFLWFSIWVGLRTAGVFAIMAVTDGEIVTLRGLGSSLSGISADPYNPSMDLDRFPNRIAVGGRLYRLTPRGWRAVLSAMLRR